MRECNEQEFDHGLNVALLKRHSTRDVELGSSASVYTPFACELLEKQLKISRLVVYKIDGEIFKNENSKQQYYCSEL